MNYKEINAANLVTHFIRGQIGVYSNYTIKVENSEDMGDVFVDITILEDGNIVQFLSFKVEDVSEKAEIELDDCNETIFIDLGEGNWEKINSYGWQVKYFWMAFLDWPQTQKQCVVGNMRENKVKKGVALRNNGCILGMLKIE